MAVEARGNPVRVRDCPADRPGRHPRAYVDQSQSLNLFTNWVFRDESMHMARQVKEMVAEAVECEVQFAEDLLEHWVSGMSLTDMREYLRHVADRRLTMLGIEPAYGSRNPFAFMELQDVQELSNFFERRVSAYQVGVSGAVSFDDDF